MSITTLRNRQSIVARARDAIVEMIRQAGMRPGDRLASEGQLSGMLTISRAALREALKLLEQEGLVRAEHGRGWFVNAAATLDVQRPITVFESVTEMLLAYGYQFKTRVLELREETADRQIAKALRCKRGAPVVRIERLRQQDGAPLVYSIDIVPRGLLPPTLTPDLFDGSLNDLLEQQHARPQMSTASVTAVELPDAVAARHGLEGFGPWLLVTETCLTGDGEAVVYAQIYHRAEIFSFNFSRR